MSKFELYKDKKGETRFRFRANNGEVMFSSEGYKAKASAVKAIESLRKNVASATVEEMEPAAKKTPAKAAAKAPAKAAKAKAPAKAAKPKAAAKAPAKAKSAAKKAKATA
ncbi:DUF1508 domain-containing protein [Chelativorans sp. AA-79]|nr:DUF1508 domain-containing protein [Chelativorans sp. AA-79]WEX07306.1 DUF1508 domain-containing protein [Chelativorans sp. AA-79]